MAYPQDPTPYPRTDATGAPIAPPPQATVQVVEVPLTPEEEAAVQEMYDELKPEATEAARNYVLNRTPARFQVAMAALIEADWPLPPVMDEAAAESRRRDSESFRRPADQPEGGGPINRDPNFNPNVDPRYPVQQPRA